MEQNHSATEVATWMVEELKSGRILYQQVAAAQIHDRFGKEFTYHNKNGNLAITKSVLDAFSRLTGDDVVWSRSQRFWRLREKWDRPGRQQP